MFTLPVLYAMRQEDEVGARLREILTVVEEDALVEEALELIKRSQGRERAQEQVNLYCEKAEAELQKLPATEATDALRELLGFALKRLG